MTWKGCCNLAGVVFHSLSETLDLLHKRMMLWTLWMAQNVITVGKGIQGDVLCVFAMTELHKHRHTAHESNKWFLDYLVVFNILLLPSGLWSVHLWSQVFFPSHLLCLFRQILDQDNYSPIPVASPEEYQRIAGQFPFQDPELDKVNIRHIRKLLSHRFSHRFPQLHTLWSPQRHKYPPAVQEVDY